MALEPLLLMSQMTVVVEILDGTYQSNTDKDKCSRRRHHLRPSARPPRIVVGVGNEIKWHIQSLTFCEFKEPKNA